ncbi:MAG: hypothetical protein M5U28_34350 [Sandaracinaceae bacterium]|nr:hypothetical protein [Sandaracinaceae bacterium]
MLAAAAAHLGDAYLELTRCDMRALSFTRGPYDAAVEPSGVVCELDDEGLVAHLASAGQNLRSGAAYLVVLLVDDDPAQRVDELLYRHSAQLADGRTATATYALLDRAPLDRWLVRRTIRVEGALAHEEVSDEYALRVRSIDAVHELARRAGLAPASVRCCETGGVAARRPALGGRVPLRAARPLSHSDRAGCSAGCAATTAGGHEA